MKYIVLCSGMLILSFGLGFLVTMILNRRSERKWSTIKRVLLTLTLGMVIMLTVAFGYLGVYYHAGEEAVLAMKGNNAVSVHKIDGGYLFDGPGEKPALVFYPGAKVECKAYAPLMLALAEEGIDCFLTEMPFNFAMFGGQRAAWFMNAYHYDSWFIAGHSMGGLMAASYAGKHAETIDGIVLLGSYPTSSVPEGIRLLSIFGKNDGCLNVDAYERGKVYWTADSTEHVIEGGNHAQFGDYGKQKGDGEAQITAKDQRDQTVALITDFCRSYNGQ